MDVLCPLYFILEKAFSDNPLLLNVNEVLLKLSVASVLCFEGKSRLFKLLSSIVL